MKKITLLLMLLVTFSGFAQFPAPYCGPMTFTSAVEPITLVDFAGINNPSSALVGVNNGTTIIAHEDYTAIVGNVTAGSSYPITLKGNTDGNFSTGLRVYVDWNQNNVFTDAGESYDIGNIVNSTGLDAVQLVGNIAVPGTALGGNTRMRVIKRYNAFGTSCQTGTGYGQTEDYTLSVTAVAACLTGVNYPDNVTVPGTCDGFTPTLIATDSWAGDYFIVTVTSGQTYKFSSSIATDYLTLSTDNGATAVTSSTTPLTWVSNITGDIRVYLNTNSSCGTEDEERETSVICGVTCLSGTLYPSATYDVPVCDGTTVNVVAIDTYAGEYSNVNVFDANDYVFSSSNPTDYITVASADGLTPLAVGTGSVSYGPTVDGVVRVYFHTNAACGTQATNRERRIVCTTALTVPECASNPTPANGSTTVPAFATFDISWDAPTTGEPATSYDLYSGTDSGNLVFEGNFTDTSIPAVGPIGAYNTLIYWQIIPRNAAGAAVGCVAWSFTTEPQPTDSPDYVNLQFPPTITVTQGGSDIVFGQVYEPGTEPNDQQFPGINAWVGISPVGSNTNPNTWTNWIAATYNPTPQFPNNNDEYQATIGADLAPGTYYYATRFSLNNGPYVYGGYTPTGGGFWDGTTNVSGVLTVTPAPPVTPNCDLVSSIPNPSLGGSTWTRPFEDGTGLSGVGVNVSYHIYGPFNVDTSGSYTFTSTQDYDGFLFVYQNSFDPNDQLTNYVAGDDDTGPGSIIITDLTTATNYYLVTTSFSPTAFGNFSTVITGAGTVDCGTLLGIPGFSDNNFSFYPNPVKNILNLSYNQEISNVEVYNLLGQKVSSTIINANDAQVDMSNLSKGAYIVKVASNNQVKTIKVIKE